MRLAGPRRPRVAQLEHRTTRPDRRVPSTPRTRFGAGRLVAAALIATSALASVQAVGSVGAAAAPPVSAGHSVGWLTALNAYRANVGLGPLGLDRSGARAAQRAADYVLASGHLAHDQDPSHPASTPDGRRAAQEGLLSGWTGLHRPERALVEDWMAAPFHALHVLDPSASQAAFGSGYSPRSARRATTRRRC
jgi:uncharacterized protein YkwD